MPGPQKNKQSEKLVEAHGELFFSGKRVKRVKYSGNKFPKTLRLVQGQGFHAYQAAGGRWTAYAPPRRASCAPRGRQLERFVRRLPQPSEGLLLDDVLRTSGTEGSGHPRPMVTPVTPKLQRRLSCSANALLTPPVCGKRRSGCVFWVGLQPADSSATPRRPARAACPRRCCRCRARSTCSGKDLTRWRKNRRGRLRTPPPRPLLRRLQVR